MRDHSAVPIASLGQRAASYWFIDGLPETAFGLALLLFGAATFLWSTHKPNAWIGLCFALVALGFLLLFWTLEILASRVAYPRTGRAADGNVTSLQTRTVLVFWLFYGLFFMINPGQPQRWLAPAVMLAVAAALHAINRNSQRPYRWWSVALLAPTGLIGLWIDIPPRAQPLLPLALGGAWLAAQGVWRLLHYLRQNPSARASQVSLRA